MANEPNVNLSIEGRYVISIKRANGDIDEVANFSNLITNTGMDYMIKDTGSNHLSYGFIGIGVTPEAITDTSMETLQSYSSQAFQGNVNSHDITGNISILKSIRFPVASSAFDISEVGMGWNTTGSVFSRALVKDGAGNPTTIAIQAGEVPYIQYKLNISFNPNDVVLAVDGYSMTLRPCNIDSIGYCSPIEGGRIRHSYLKAYNNDAVMGDILNTPSGGVSYNETSYSDQDYTNGSYQRSGNVIWSSTTANEPLGLKIFIVTQGQMTWQFEVSPNIPKDDTETLNIELTTSWTRV